MKKCTCPACGHAHERMRKATTDEQQERAAKEGRKGARAAARAREDDAKHEAAEMGERVQKAYSKEQRHEVRRDKAQRYGKEVFAVPRLDSYPLTKDGEPDEERTMAAWRYIHTEKDESKLPAAEAAKAKSRIRAFAKKHFGKELESGPEETKKALDTAANLPTDEVYALQHRSLWPLTKALQPDAGLVRGAWRALHSTRAQSLLPEEDARVAEVRIRHFAEHHHIDLTA